MGTRLALVAGISAYSGRWTALSSCVNDADQVAEALTLPEYEYQVTRLTDEEVTKAEILRWLIEARTSGAEQILFYFAGHGAATQLGTYLVTYDNSEFDEGVLLSDLIRIADPDAGSRTQVLFLLDCCHSGGAVSGTSSAILRIRSLNNADVSQVVQRMDPSIAVIAACAEDQRAWEVSNLGHGVFTYYLLSALLGDAADHTGSVTAHSIYDVISREMDSRDGHEQVPIFGGRIQGRMVLGQRLTPSLSPPRPEEEYARYEREAQSFLDGYNSFKAQFNLESWRTDGYFSACRKLEDISRWFEKKDQIEGMSTRNLYKRSRETLVRYQAELGMVETGTRLRWGILDEQIGAGGFGKVWKVASGGGNLLAYKLYHAYELHDKEKVRRFRNGYDAMRMLSDPRIVQVYDYSDCPPGFTMDYIDGSNLRELSLANFMDPVDIFAILHQSGEAIEHAHRHEVIHRDIKPENIICSLEEGGDYRPYLTDFDLAWFSTQTQKATKTAMGVVYYAAPEQYIAFDPKIARSKNPTLDVFSFGQLMYFCLTGRDPDPLNIESNSNYLGQILARRCPTKTAAMAIALYKECTQFDSSKRVQNFSHIVGSIGEITQELTHSSTETSISREEYSAELAFQMTRSLRSGEPSTTFVNASGGWQVSMEWKERAHKRSSVPVLSMHIKPTRRMSLENVANERMRTILNRRIDSAISSYAARAQRHPGRRGDFEFFLEWRLDKITRADALVLSDILRSIFSSLDA
ncbi:hypothetical protein DQ384_10385 [Sphaerisporangium album]|uniref:non-specific serine/threonine protein kinase n=1 Tax=Sphaerisporangium album TaxID=509200 RepID=A0A367FL68_9ACTN|nr:caspase family protein [Sphaerisporangium album]RCG31146.1 hypothetical protein DQ384_10385 [Sphaerisporangium album]